MPAPANKRIGARTPVKQPSLADNLHDTWKIMKPLVKFSIGALKLVAHTLIFIVKHIPKPEEHTPRSKNNKVIKI